MGIFDRAKEALSGHSEQVEAVVDKAGDFVDEKTEGKYAEQVDKVRTWPRTSSATWRLASRSSQPEVSPFSALAGSDSASRNGRGHRVG